MIYRLVAMVILYLMTPINATPQNIPPQQTRSSQDISEIDSLTSQIVESKKSADWWQNGYLMFGFAAVVFAALTAYFQYEATKRARTVADDEEALSRLKESGFIASLKDKDVRIAELDLERVKLEQNLLWFGPRQVLIDTKRDSLLSRLKAFRGQKFTTEVCWEQALIDHGQNELMFSENAVFRVLSDSGWIFMPSNFEQNRKPVPGPRIVQNCGAFGIWPRVHPVASASTASAAKELLSILDEVLRQRGILDRTAQLNLKDLIIVRVGAHPLAPANPQK